MANSKKQPTGTKAQTTDSQQCYVTQFRHWRSGEIIYAKDYGLKAFPIGRRK